MHSSSFGPPAAVVDHSRRQLRGELYGLQIAHQAVADRGGELAQHRVSDRIDIPPIRVAHRVGPHAAAAETTAGRNAGTEYRKKIGKSGDSRRSESAELERLSDFQWRCDRHCRCHCRVPPRQRFVSWRKPREQTDHSPAASSKARTASLRAPRSSIWAVSRTTAFSKTRRRSCASRLAHQRGQQNRCCPAVPPSGGSPLSTTSSHP